MILLIRLCNMLLNPGNACKAPLMVMKLYKCPHVRLNTIPLNITNRLIIFDIIPHGNLTYFLVGCETTLNHPSPLLCGEHFFSSARIVNIVPLSNYLTLLFIYNYCQAQPQLAI